MLFWFLHFRANSSQSFILIPIFGSDSVWSSVQQPFSTSTEWMDSTRWIRFNFITGSFFLTHLDFFLLLSFFLFFENKWSCINILVKSSLNGTSFNPRQLQIHPVEFSTASIGSIKFNSRVEWVNRVRLDRAPNGERPTPSITAAREINFGRLQIKLSCKLVPICK